MEKTISKIHPNMKWEQIKIELEFEIISGNMKSGEKFYSIDDVSKTFQVSKTTAKKVLELMCEDGTISRRMGIGFFVVPCKKIELKEKYVKALEEKVEDLCQLAEALDLESDDIREMIKDLKKK